MAFRAVPCRSSCTSFSFSWGSLCQCVFNPPLCNFDFRLQFQSPTTWVPVLLLSFLFFRFSATLWHMDQIQAVVVTCATAAATARSTHCAGPEIEPGSWRCRDSANPIAPQWKLPFFFFFFFPDFLLSWLGVSQSVSDTSLLYKMDTDLSLVNYNIDNKFMLSKDLS